MTARALDLDAIASGLAAVGIGWRRFLVYWGAALAAEVAAVVVAVINGTWVMLPAPVAAMVAVVWSGRRILLGLRHGRDATPAAPG